MFNDTQHRHLVMWAVTPVPEPGMMVGIAVVVMVVGRRTIRKSRVGRKGS
jgi:hypothetical protein